MLKIDVRTIPHNEQRYDTVGDYWLEFDGTFHIRVSDLRDWKMEFLISIHEQIEQILCLARGISEADITQFDIEHPDLTEPGASLEAPYHKEHVIATKIELELAKQLGVDWQEYEDKINNL